MKYMMLWAVSWRFKHYEVPAKNLTTQSNGARIVVFAEKQPSILALQIIIYLLLKV